MTGGKQYMATFRKSIWMGFALENKAKGIFSQQDIDNACATWVDELDGKEIDLADEQNQSLERYCE